MKSSMTREEYNREYVKGKVDDSYLVLRNYNGVCIVNLECSNRECGKAHVQVFSDIIHRNCHSDFQQSVCSMCLSQIGIRVSKKLKIG